MLIDTCEAGVCIGVNPKLCPTSPCYERVTCDPPTGTCGLDGPRPDGTPCDDNSLCTSGETCQAGECVGAEVVACEPACTKKCQASTGKCVDVDFDFTDGTPCDTGMACAIAAECQAGACVETQWHDRIEVIGEAPLLPGIGFARHVFPLGDNHVVVASSFAVEVFSIQAQGAPVPVGRLKLPVDMDLWARAAVDGDLMLRSERGHVWVIDVSEPTEPVMASELEPPHYGTSALALDGVYGYIGHGAGLTVLDLTDPAQPVVAGEVAAPAIGHLVVAGDRLYAEPVTATGASLRRLRIYSLADPAHPALVGDAPWGVPDDHDVLLVTANELGLVLGQRHRRSPTGLPDAVLVADASDPAALTVLSEIAADEPLPDSAFGGRRPVALAGSLLGVAREAELELIDISVPGAPETLGTVAGVAPIVGLASRDVRMMVVSDVARWHGYGLSTIDVSDPIAPATLGTFAEPGYPEEADTAGGFAFVAYGEAGLRIYDLGDPTKPALVGALPVDGDLHSVHVVGDRAYVADYAADLVRVVDISDPSAPVQVASVPAADPWFVRQYGGLLCILSEQTLTLADASGDTPTLLYSGPPGGWRLARAGNLLFVNKVWVSGAPYSGGSIDISDPTQPVLKRDVPDFGDVAVRDDRWVYLTVLHRILVMDSDAPSSPPTELTQWGAGLIELIPDNDLLLISRSAGPGVYETAALRHVPGSGNVYGVGSVVTESAHWYRRIAPGTAIAGTWSTTFRVLDLSLACPER
jgi:hypothetical protein